MKNTVIIVQGNDLLEASYNLSTDAMRLLNIALSKIDSKQTKPSEPYIISVDEFRGYYAVDLHNVHTRLRDAADELMTNPITIYSQHPTKEDVIVTTKYAWLVYLQYDSALHSGVLIEFSPYVSPYLYQLARDFTQVKFEYIVKLNTPFTIRLYCWLNKVRHMNIHKKGNVFSCELDIDWIKERAGLISKYGDIRNFQRTMINPAIKKINANTDISVTYEPVKQKRVITAFKFSYVEESPDKKNIVTRPRLPRRPPARTGTHLEGEWVRKCINILLKYEVDLKQVKGDKLPREDAKKLIRYSLMVGDKFLADDVRKRYGIDTDKLTVNRISTANTDGYLAPDGKIYESKIAYYQQQLQQC